MTTGMGSSLRSTCTRRRETCPTHTLPKSVPSASIGSFRSDTRTWMGSETVSLHAITSSASVRSPVSRGVAAKRRVKQAPGFSVSPLSESLNRIHVLLRRMVLSTIQGTRPTLHRFTAAFTVEESPISIGWSTSSFTSMVGRMIEKTASVESRSGVAKFCSRVFRPITGSFEQVIRREPSGANSMSCMSPWKAVPSPRSRFCASMSKT